MTQRERFIKALRREPLTGLVPHFELVFLLTMDVFGKRPPAHNYNTEASLTGLSGEEKNERLRSEAAIYVEIARKFNHSAIFVQATTVRSHDTVKRLLNQVRELSGDEYFIMVHGDPTHGMPDGHNMMEMSVQMYEEPEKLNEVSERRMEEYLGWAKALEGTGLLDGFAMCSDYGFNVNPFFSPDMFAELVTPYLKRIIDAYREMGYYSIKHSDGNIMPILDQIIGCAPDALHSIDPQGGMDLKLVKQLYGDKVCMIGNVNCGLLQTGTIKEVETDVLRSLRDGMPGYGYIFSTSNCVYLGLPFERYELMHKLWRKHGIYK